MATISPKSVSDADAVTKEVYEEIMRTYGLDEPREIYLLMGQTPAFLASNWRRSNFLFGTKTRFSIKLKHILTLAISSTNNCEYCARLHTDRLKQLGMTAGELIELLMVVDLVNGYDKFAEGTRLGGDPTIPYLAEDGADAALKEVYDDIGKAYGNKEPDSIYRLMSYKPEYLKASWQRSRLCFEEEGKLGLRLKHTVALCVAATNGSDHFVEAHTGRLKELGVTDEELVEVLFIVDVVCGYNRYVQGMQANPRQKPWGAHAESTKAASAEADAAASCRG